MFTMYILGACRDQKRVFDTLELEFKIVVSHVGAGNKTTEPFLQLHDVFKRVLGIGWWDGVRCC